MTALTVDRAALDRAVSRLTTDTATLTDIANVLHRACRGDLPAERHEALEELCLRALARFSTFTRYAPPLALAAVVDASLVTCGCGGKVAPWDGGCDVCRVVA